MAKWKHSFEAINPAALSGTWTIGVYEQKLAIMRRSGHEAKLARYVLAFESATDPILLIRGWHRVEMDDQCFVYVGRPKRDYYGESVEVPAKKGRLFLVFVLGNGTIDDWGWRDAEKNNPYMPQGMTGEVLWPT